MKLLMTSVLTESSTTASESCAIARVVRARLVRPPVLRVPASRNAACGSFGAIRSAGTSPTSNVVSPANAIAKTRTSRLNVGGRRRKTAGPSFEQHCDRAPRNQNSSRASDRGEQQTLGEQLPRDSRASGTERGAHRDLPAARHPTRKQQVGQVCAGDEQHKERSADEEVERPCEISNDKIGEWLDRDRLAGVVFRIHRREMLGDARHLQLRARARDPRTEQRVHFLRTTATAISRVGRKVAPHGAIQAAGPREIRRHHADDAHGQHVQLQRLSKNARVAAEFRPPDSRSRGLQRGRSSPVRQTRRCRGRETVGRERR